jgi:dTDP-4-dehydrorhamnose reductase
MARILERLLESRPALEGLYHVASRPISKFDLLGAFRDALGLATKIVPYSDFHCDRSLDGSRFAAASGYVAPEWPQMVAELAGVLKEKAK